MSSSTNMMMLADTVFLPKIIMLLDDSPKILLVEGTKDKRVYQTLFRSVRVEGTKGKNSVVACIRKIEAKQKYSGRCMALIDRDYDFFMHKETQSDQIVYIDAHSLETLMWMTDREEDMLPSIVNEMIDARTIYEVQQQMAHIYDSAYKAAYWVGLIRLANMQHGWGINFTTYKFQDNMFNPDTDELDIIAFLNHLLAGTANESKKDEILSAILDLKKNNWNQWELMQGHDISSAFIYMVKLKCTFYPPEWDGWDDPETAMRDFESKTRMACNIEKLKKATFYEAIQKWAVS